MATVLPVIVGFVGTVIIALLGIIYSGISKRLDIIDTKLDHVDTRLTRMESWKEIVTLPDVLNRKRRATDYLEE